MKDVNLAMAYDKLMEEIEDCKVNPDIEKELDWFCSKVAYKQYGIGGECLHRGYYCPSKIYDIVVGNISRGRITKQEPVDSLPPFTFGFDSQNKLILVKQPDSSELIYYKDQSEIGISVSNEMKIQSLSKCHFCEGKLYSYSFCLFDPYTRRIVELTKEKYAYLKNQVQVDWSRVAASNNTMVKQHENYIFSIEDEYLTSYRVNGLAQTTCNNHLFKVQHKRKI